MVAICLSIRSLKPCSYMTIVAFRAIIDTWNVLIYIHITAKKKTHILQHLSFQINRRKFGVGGGGGG